ncbi:MAG: UDP-N-acetylglucosamine 1-carboxyvinyltransferase [bacterium]
MEKFIIKGGKRLQGSVSAGGSKNAALPIIAASLLVRGKTELSNVPSLKDVRTMCDVLRVVGAKVYSENDRLLIDTSTCDHPAAPYELVKTMRASILVMGPLTASMSKARISKPGGCAIGLRPVDQHLKGIRALGAQVDESHGYFDIKADRLKGAEIYMDEPSVTATENIVMAASMAEGKTIIHNAAREPHVVDLMNFLNKMGAKIENVGSDVLILEGVEELHPVRYSICPDQIEADTFMVAAAITSGDVLIKNCSVEVSASEVAKLREMGVSVEKEEGGVRVVSEGNLNASYVKTLPYPGFPTDLQPQITSLLTVARGTSMITEGMYEKRFTHVPELQRMGADIKIEGRNAIVNGVTRLGGAMVMASDIRAGAALVLAGLAAEGETHISRIYHIDRGYDHIEKKFELLGGDIKRVEE